MKLLGYDHVFGAMDRDSALKIASLIENGYFINAVFCLRESTRWTYDRSTSFIDRYKLWSEIEGKFIASQMFLKENFVTDFNFDLIDFITSKEMEIQ